jgi:hypothetical protein
MAPAGAKGRYFRILWRLVRGKRLAGALAQPLAAGFDSDRAGE